MRLIRTATAALLAAPFAAASLGSSPAWAADEPVQSGGMPQLDFANPLTTSQLVWMAIIFAVLYMLLARWALPQVGAVVEHRAGTIAADLDTARLSKAEADAAVEELTVATRRAHADAQAQIASALAVAKDAAAKQTEAQNRKLETQLHEAEARIQSARQAAMGALRHVAAETAATVVARLTGHNPAPDSVDAAVGRAIAARSPV